MENIWKAASISSVFQVANVNESFVSLMNTYVG